MKKYMLAILLSGMLAANVFAAENLKLNPHLDYSSDSHDGPLITGDNIQSGLIAGKPNYIIIFGEACYNSKRQARRTVELYGKYRDKVNFVVIDLDTNHSPEHQALIKKFYRGYIPHVAVVGKSGETLYESSGEVESSRIETLFQKAVTGQ